MFSNRNKGVILCPLFFSTGFLRISSRWNSETPINPPNPKRNAIGYCLAAPGIDGVLKLNPEEIPMNPVYILVYTINGRWRVYIEYWGCVP